MIVYDLQGAQSVHHGERGIARYVVELAQALERVQPGIVDRFVVNPDLPMPPSLDPLLATRRVSTCDAPDLSTASVFHVASPMENGIAGHRLLPLPVRAAGARVVATVYDLIPMIYPERYLGSRQNWAEYGRGLAVLCAADELLAISRATADDAQRLLGIPARHLTMIGAGAGPQFRRPSAIEHTAAEADLFAAFPGLRRGFVLMPTGIDYRKNVEGSIEAYASLPPALRHAHQLVIACRVDDATRQRLRSLTDVLGVSDDVLFTGFVSDGNLVQLYQTTVLVVFPSRYEGFGLPPLEARSCGAPVICSGTSSLPEVIVDPRAQFDPDDVDDIARSMRQVLTDYHLRAELARTPLPSFTWDLAAQRTIPVYQRLLAKQPSRPRGERVATVARPRPTYPGVTAVAAERATVESNDGTDVVAALEPWVAELQLEAGLVDRIVDSP